MKTTYVLKTIVDASSLLAFQNEVQTQVTSMQQEDLCIEVQYQQTDKFVSALVLGKVKHACCKFCKLQK